MRSPIIALMLLAGCTAGPPLAQIAAPPPIVPSEPARPRTLTDTEWHAVEIGGIPVIAGSGVSLSLQDRKAFGSSGCGEFSGSFSVYPVGRILFSQIDPPRNCRPAGIGAQERRFLQILSSAEGFRIDRAADGSRLTLGAPGGQSIVFRQGPMIAVNGSRAAVVAATPASAILLAEWHAREIDGVPVMDGPPVTLRFDNGRANGRVCNGYGGTYAFLPGQGIRFGMLATTRMSCGEARDAQERRFFSVLRDTMTYSVQGGRGGRWLILTAQDGRTIRFSHGSEWKGGPVTPAR